MVQAEPQHLTIVLGMHRSGTSLCSHVLSVLGFDMASEVAPKYDNPKGHWERWELVDFHDRILAILGRDWAEPSHTLAFPHAWWAEPSIRAIRNEMVAWLRSRIGTSGRFGFKDPRTCLLLPLWNEICAELGLVPRLVFCVRPPALVARSLATRSDVPDLREGEHRWLAYNSRAIADFGPRPVCVIPYERWFEPGAANLKALLAFLNLDHLIGDPMIEDAVDAIVVPDLRHHRPEPTVRNSVLTDVFYRHLLAHPSGREMGASLRDMAVNCYRFEQFIEPIRHAAHSVAHLQTELAARDARITDGIIREGQLLAEMATMQDRVTVAEASNAAESAAMHAELAARDRLIAEAATRESALQAELAGRDIAIAEALAREGERRAEIASAQDHAHRAQLSSAAEIAGLRAELAVRDMARVDVLAQDDGAHAPPDSSNAEALDPTEKAA